MHINKIKTLNNSIKNIRFNWLSFILAILFSLFCSIGMNFRPYGEGIGHISAVKLILFMILNIIWLYPAAYYLIGRLSRADISGDKDENIERFAFTFSLLTYAIILLVWYPGIMTYDALYQIEQYLGNYTLNNHHPVVVSFCFGFIFSIGSRISDNVGAFLIAIINIFMWAGAITFTVHKLCEWGIRPRICKAVVFFYTLYPVLQIYAVSISKDSWFFPIMTVFFVIYLDIYKKEDASLKDTCALAITGILACFFRHGVLLYIIPAIIVLIVFKVRKKRIIIAGLLLTAVVAIGSLCIEKAYPRETYDEYSVLFQLTARHLTLFPEDVTPDELAAINKVMDPDKAVSVYNPQVSDDVKRTVSMKAPTDEDIALYKSYWIKMFSRHPLSYMEGFLNGCYGYLDPFTISFGHPDENGELLAPPCETFMIDKLHEGDDAAIRNFSRIRWFFWMRAAYMYLLIILVYLRLAATGIWTWLTMLSGGLILKKREWKDLSVLIIPTFQIGLCLLSPVNTNLRYALPQISMSVILFLWVLLLKESKALPCKTKRKRGKQN